MCFRQLDADIKEGFLLRIGEVFGVDRKEASRLCALLLECMDHRQSVGEGTIRFDLFTIGLKCTFILMCFR